MLTKITIKIADHGAKLSKKYESILRETTLRNVDVALLIVVPLNLAFCDALCLFHFTPLPLPYARPTRWYFRQILSITGNSSRLELSLSNPAICVFCKWLTWIVPVVRWNDLKSYIRKHYFSTSKHLQTILSFAIYCYIIALSFLYQKPILM